MRRYVWMWMALAAAAGITPMGVGDEISVSERVLGKKTFKYLPKLTNVLVLSEDRTVVYLANEGDQLVKKTVQATSSRRVTVKRASEAERAALIEKWETTVRCVEFERAAGGPVRLLSPTVRYPLPAGLTLTVLPPSGAPPSGSPQGGSPQSGSTQGGVPKSGSPQGGSPQGGLPPFGLPTIEAPPRTTAGPE